MSTLAEQREVATKFKGIAPKVSIVMPAYNEEERIIGRIQSLTRYFDRVVGEYEFAVYT